MDYASSRMKSHGMVEDERLNAGCIHKIDNQLSTYQIKVPGVLYMLRIDNASSLSITVEENIDGPLNKR